MFVSFCGLRSRVRQICRGGTALILLLLAQIASAQQTSVSGTVTLEDGANYATSLTFDFCATDRALLLTRQVTPNSSGAFTITDIPKGTYTLSVKGSRWLRKNVSVSTVSGDVTGLSVGVLKGGDADDSNTVDVLDLDILIQSFDLCQNDPGYIASADFNNDTCVDVLDLDIYLRNNDTSGQAYATRLQASGTSSGITLTWIGSTPDVSEYKVYRATSAMGTYTALPGTVSGTTTTDSPGVGLFYYKVTALNGNGESVLSNVASAAQLPSSLFQIDTAQPGWAEDIIPTDSPAAVGAGPSSATSIDVATGILENRPGADILARNPVGISPSFSRLYRSAQAARGYGSPGLTAGWTHNYDLYVTPVVANPTAWVNVRLTYPNGASEEWSPDPMNPTGPLTPQTPGTPYCVTGDASNTVGRWDSLTIIYKDLSTMVFEPSASNPHLYLLKRMTNAAGRAILLNYGAGDTLTSITNDASQTLLQFAYSGTLTQVTDVPGGRYVKYQFGAIPNSSLTGLLWVSQINSLTNKQWEYNYEALGSPAWPLLTQVGVLDPVNPANGMKFYPASQHDTLGRITTFTDANNNRRVYHFRGGYTEVEARRADNTLDLTWLQRYDGIGADAGTMDAKGYGSSVIYGDMLNPKKPSQLVNRNGQITDIERDAYGNVTLIKTPFKNQILVTEFAYDYNPNLWPAGKLSSVQESNLNVVPGGLYKTPTTYAYYGANVIINGALQPRGMLRTITEPVPGTTNGSTQTAVEYVYTELGNIRTITTPGPNNGAAITVTYEYLDDSAFGPDPYSRTTEVIEEPLRITFPRNNSFATASLHLRYDVRGNVVRSYDELGNRTDYEYYDTNRLKKIIFPPTTTVLTNRASIVYTYQHLDGSGSVVSASIYSENGALLREVLRKSGNEDEFKYLDGPVVQTFPQYDALYRQTGIKNGKQILAQQYGYDAAGNFTGTTYFNGTTTRFTNHDAAGNVKERTDGLNRATTYDLAPEDSRLRQILYPDPTHNAVQEYDDFGRISSITDRTGIRAYQYDHLDNITHVTTTYFASNGLPLPAQMVEYEYHTDGARAFMHLTTQDTLGGNPVVWTTKYLYNPDGSLLRMEFPWEYFQVSSQPSTGDVDFTYDIKGRLTQTLQTRLQADYAYNERDFLLGLKNTSRQTGNPVISTFGSLTTPAQYITYDAQGLPLSVPYTLRITTTNDSSGTISYSYDSKFRLSAEQRTLAAVGGTLYNIPFTLDDANNLTNARGNTFPPNNADQIDLSGFLYDNNGTLYQSQGQERLTNGTPGNVYSYNLAYDFEERPVSIGNIQEAFTIEGQRAWKLVGAGERTYFLYDGDTLIAELDSQCRLRVFYGMSDSGLLQRYNQQFPNTNSAGRFVRTYAYDPNGHLANRIRHNDFSFNWPAASTSIYDAYGGLWYDWGLPSGGFNPPTTNVWFNQPDAIGGFGLFGEYTDIEARPNPNLTTPLVLMGDQYYDGQTGRFQVRSGGVNEYDLTDATDEDLWLYTLVEATDIGLEIWSWLSDPIGMAREKWLKPDDAPKPYVLAGSGRIPLVNIGKFFRELARRHTPWFPPRSVDSYSRAGGHHPHAQAAFSHLPRNAAAGQASYHPGRAITISQAEMQRRWGLRAHDNMTARQARLYDEMLAGNRPNTLREHTRIAVEVLRAGGANRQEARLLTARSLRNLRAQGIRQNTPLRIPRFPPFMPRR